MYAFVITLLLFPTLVKILLNPIQVGLFWGSSRIGERCKKAPLPKICHTYPTMMKLDEKEYTNHATHPLSSVDISIFSAEISKFYYIKKYRYRLYFDT